MDHPLERMCIAWWDAARGTTDGSTWKSLNAVDRANSLKRMRAAVLDLVKMEPTQDMYLAGDKAQDCGESATEIARAYMRPVAEYKTTREDGIMPLLR